MARSNRHGGPADSAWEECLEVTASIERKAGKNKRRARVVTLVMIGSTAMIPVVLAYASSDFWQRLVPSVLAAVSVVAGTWAQFEKPHERWVLYRRYHRILQGEQNRYKYRLDAYAAEADDESNKRLAARLVELQLQLHREWEGLVPATDELGGVQTSPGSSHGT
ncbi:MAG: DUF4231 domain-containing protein [Acidimicrobiales bacterium]